jgi:hypothetical protein
MNARNCSGNEVIYCCAGELDKKRLKKSTDTMAYTLQPPLLGAIGYAMRQFRSQEMLPSSEIAHKAQTLRDLEA